jgi:ribosomal protein L35
MASKVKKVKVKTHKASSKRFSLTKNGKVMHQPQGGGNGHSNNYKNRRQRSADKGAVSLTSKKESAKIRSLLGA